MQLYGPARSFLYDMVNLGKEKRQPYEPAFSFPEPDNLTLKEIPWARTMVDSIHCLNPAVVRSKAADGNKGFKEVAEETKATTTQAYAVAREQAFKQAEQYPNPPVDTGKGGELVMNDRLLIEEAVAAFDTWMKTARKMLDMAVQGPKGVLMPGHGMKRLLGKPSALFSDDAPPPGEIPKKGTGFGGGPGAEGGS